MASRMQPSVCPVCKDPLIKKDSLEDLMNCPECMTYAHAGCIKFTGDRCPCFNCKNSRPNVSDDQEVSSHGSNSLIPSPIASSLPSSLPGLSPKEVLARVDSVSDIAPQIKEIQEAKSRAASYNILLCPYDRVVLFCKRTFLVEPCRDADLLSQARITKCLPPSENSQVCVGGRWVSKGKNPNYESELAVHSRRVADLYTKVVSDLFLVGRYDDAIAIAKESQIDPLFRKVCFAVGCKSLDLGQQSQAVSTFLDGSHVSEAIEAVFDPRFRLGLTRDDYSCFYLRVAGSAKSPVERAILSFSFYRRISDLKMKNAVSPRFPSAIPNAAEIALLNFKSANEAAYQFLESQGKLDEVLSLAAMIDDKEKLQQLRDSSERMKKDVQYLQAK